MNYFQQSLFKNLLMTISENHFENIGRRHTKAIESFNIFNTPKKKFVQNHIGEMIGEEI